MILLKVPGSIEEAVVQRNFLAGTLAEVLTAQGYIASGETLDGKGLVSRAKRLANEDRRVIRLAEPGRDQKTALFRGHVYPVSEVFPALVILFSRSGRWQVSAYGWCPVGDAELTHRRLAGYNGGSLPGLDHVDESREVVIVNLDNEVANGRGFPARIPGRDSQEIYIADVLRSLPPLD